MYKEFYDRINLNTELSTLSKIICKQFDLGKYVSKTLITVGYEDFNYIVETSKGKFCIKIFSKERTDVDCKTMLIELN